MDRNLLRSESDRTKAMILITMRVFIGTVIEGPKFLLTQMGGILILGIRGNDENRYFGHNIGPKEVEGYKRAQLGY